MIIEVKQTRPVPATKDVDHLDVGMWFYANEILYIVVDKTCTLGHTRKTVGVLRVDCIGLPFKQRREEFPIGCRVLPVDKVKIKAEVG